MNRQGAERCRRAGTRTLLHPKEQALDQTEEEGEEEKAFSMRQGTTLMIKLFAMAAEAGERSHEGGPQRSKTIMVRSDILRLPISDRPTAGQTRCVLRSGRRRVPDANNNGRCPILPSYYVLAYVQISFLL